MIACGLLLICAGLFASVSMGIRTARREGSRCGLYEVIIGAIVFAIAWPLRKHLRQPSALTWLVLALLAVGRSFEFFLCSDSAEVALGLY